jgi:hypothetical protein
MILLKQPVGVTMIYMMGKPVKTAKPAAPVVVPVVSKAAPKARIQPVQCELSQTERKLARIYGRLPFSFANNWDARLEPPA